MIRGSSAKSGNFIYGLRRNSGKTGTATFFRKGSEIFPADEKKVAVPIFLAPIFPKTMTGSGKGPVHKERKTNVIQENGERAE